MGATQSSNLNTGAPPFRELKDKENVTINSSSSSSNNNSDTTNSDDKISIPKKKKGSPKNLKGYALIEYKCRKKRAKYDQCYRQTHSAFVVGKKLFDTDGDEIDHKASCEELFEAYKDCIYKGMMKDRKDRGLSAAKPESALGDYFEEDEE